MSGYKDVLAGTYDNHVLPFLWMKGEDRATITEYLEKIAASDIHEICLESRPHPDFCGPGWFDDLRFMIEEGKRLGLKYWILDDAHFPTGYANGALEKDDVDPALRKTVLTHRVVEIVGPGAGRSIALSNMFDKTERFVGAVAECAGEPVAVEHKDGELRLDAPAGKTKVTMLFTSQKTGYRDEYMNMVDTASCHLLIDAVYEPHYRELGDEFGKTILGFFSDEPGFMNEKGLVPDGSLVADSQIGKALAPLPWSEELRATLCELLGSADEQLLFTTLAKLWDRDEQGAYARHVYMDAATRMYRKAFCEQLGAWCREHGVLYIGHVIEDKDYNVRLGQGAGHFFRAIDGEDMAGVDIVINQLVPGLDAGGYSYGRGSWDLDFFTHALAKLGSSAAHIDPKKQGRCMAEVFGAFGWHEGLKEMTWIANHFLVRGVNWYVPHAFSMAPFPDWDCPPHFYAHGNNPQFRQFGKLMTYMNRMATLLSGGTAHTPVAVLYHADASWAGKAMPIETVAAELGRNQIDFDFIPADVFSDAERYKVEETKTGFSVNGQEYRCLVMPEAQFVGKDVVAFVQSAACPVICVNAAPAYLYDGAEAASAGYAPVPAGALAKAAIVELGKLVQRLKNRGFTEVVTSDPQPFLRAYRYDRAGEEYLFVVNEHPVDAVKTTLSDANGKPYRGVQVDVLNEAAPEVFAGTLELEAYEARLIVLGESLSEALDVAASEPHDVELGAPWELSFAAPLSYPTFSEEREVAAPAAAQEDAAFFDRCGTFRYETSFELTEEAELKLAVEEAYEMVEVYLDGEAVGARIAPPYKLGLGTVAPGEHKLTIDVTNTVDKAVADMFALTEAKEPSGILGQVKLQAK